MADQAHEWTDEQIERIQTKLRQVYSQAANEMQDNLEAWLEDFDRKNKAWKKAVSEGVKTEGEYKAWLEDRAMERTWQQDMINTLTYDAVNADVRARQLINDEVPTIYAENGNWATYDIERQAGLDTAFTLYNQDSIRWLVEEDRQLLPQIDVTADIQWHRQKFTSMITQSILQGESIPKAAARIALVTGMDERASERAARTAMTLAENKGRQRAFERADGLGITLTKEWNAHLDGRTRLSHRQADGQKVGIHEKFVVGGYKMEEPGDNTDAPGSEVYNCFTSDNKVITDSEILASYKREYSGKLVTVHTATGVDFTCTPNHPILTVDGWVRAERLHEGSNLLITSIIDSEIPSRYPDINHIMPSFEAVHELLCMLSAKRTRRLGVNFHGDIATSDVEIVRKERLLGVDGDSFGSEEVAKLLLENSDSSGSGLRSLSSCFKGVMRPASSDMSSERISLAFLGGHIAHPNVHGLRASSMGNPFFVENFVDDLSAMPNLDGELLCRLTRKVGVDNVVGIEVKYGTSQVYNLQTENGYYLVGGNNGITIIAKNCRCHMGGIVDEDGLPPAVIHRYSKLPKNVSYEEWKAGRYVTDRNNKETKASKKERGVE